MRRRERITDFRAGLVGIVVVALAAFFAFTMWNPLSHPFELEAVFRDSQNLQPDSPVRVAGVEVGKVTKVEPLEGGSPAAKVTMELQDRALPVHRDARLQIRPRLFLEGNYFVDLKPGSPSAPALASGDTVPVNQTAYSVSFEQILKVLDKDTRGELQTLLDEYSRGLARGGAKAFNRSIQFWREAYRTTALANQALLGTEPGDLARLVRGQQETFGALARDPRALESLITDLNRTTAAFAREDDALAASIPALRDALRQGLPTLAALNGALPSVRGFARDALPGVRTAAPALRAGRPFIAELRALVSKDELKGTAAELRRTIPSLVRLNRATVPFLGQARALSSCTANVLVPFAQTPIPDPDFPDNSGQPFYKESQRAFTALAGESRTGDANGQWFRLLAGSGPTTAVYPGAGVAGETLFAQELFPQLGTRPAKPAERPSFRPDVPCETQEPPDLAAPAGPADQTVQANARTSRPRSEAAARELERIERFIARDRAGKRARDPLGSLRVAKPGRAAR